MRVCMKSNQFYCCDWIFFTLLQLQCDAVFGAVLSSCFCCCCCCFYRAYFPGSFVHSRFSPPPSFQVSFHVWLIRAFCHSNRYTIVCYITYTWLRLSVTWRYWSLAEMWRGLESAQHANMAKRRRRSTGNLILFRHCNWKLKYSTHCILVELLYSALFRSIFFCSCHWCYRPLLPIATLTLPYLMWIFFILYLVIFMLCLPTVFIFSSFFQLFIMIHLH